jgi:site-specific recombinase XerD
MERQEYIDQFIDFCEYSKGLSVNTIRAYKLNLQQYLSWLEGKDLSPTGVKVGDIDAFIISIRKKNNSSSSTINQKIYCLKSFYRWLQRNDLIQKNPMDLVDNMKQAKRLPVYLTEGQQTSLLQASGVFRKLGNTRDAWLRQRDELLVLTFLDTGLRVSELVDIEVKNLDLKQGVLKVIGKGDKEREVILSDRLVKAIAEYLRAIKNEANFNGFLPGRGSSLSKLAKATETSYQSAYCAVRKGASGSERLRQIKSFLDEKVKPEPVKFLFFGQGGCPMATRHIFRLVRDIGKKAGIKNLHPHTLRHSFASNLRRKKADLLIIKEALGHASVSTTQIYAHLGSEDYRQELRSLIN